MFPWQLCFYRDYWNKHGGLGGFGKAFLGRLNGFEYKGSVMFDVNLHVIANEKLMNWV